MVNRGVSKLNKAYYALLINLKEIVEENVIEISDSRN